MANFALDTNSSPQEIISSLNYALATVGSGSTANALVANTTSGTVTNVTSGNVVSYLYQWINVRYADSADGATNFSTSPTNRDYYGVRNSTASAASSNPADYIWYQVAAGGFGTTKFLFYSTYGGYQIAWAVATAAPNPFFVQTVDGQAIDLSALTTTIPITNINITYPEGQYIVQGNAGVFTPNAVGNIVTLISNVQAVRADSIVAAIDQDIQYFTGNGYFHITSNTSTGFNANAFSFTSPFSTAYNVSQTAVFTDYSTTVSGVISAALLVNSTANVGPQGPRGTVPLGYVVTVNDPNTATSANLTAQFQEPRTNTVPPIGLGIGVPVTNDTVQFFYPDPLLPGGGITSVKLYNGSVWANVTANVVSGDTIYTGTVTSSKLNANDVYVLKLQSTNANIGNTSSAGFWLDSTSGDARFAGNTSIGNSLIVGANASIGANLTVGANATIGTNLLVGANATVGVNAVIGDNLHVGNDTNVGNNLLVGANAAIGNNLSVGADATIGANLNVTGLVTSGSLSNNTVNTNTIVDNAVTETLNLITTQGTSQVAFLANSALRGFWPANTRGAVLASSINSGGSPLQGNVQINYSATVYSDANSEYNCVEIWKWNPYSGNAIVNTDRIVKKVVTANVAGSFFFASGAYGTVLACNNHSSLTPFANISTFAYSVTNNFNAIMSNGKVISNTYSPGMQVYDATTGWDAASGSTLDGHYLVGSGGAIFKPDGNSNFLTGNTIQSYQGLGNWANNSDIYRIWDGGYSGFGTFWPQWIVGQNGLIGYRAFGGQGYVGVTPTQAEKSWITYNPNNAVINGVNLNDITPYYANLASPATSYTGMVIVGDAASVLRANTGDTFTQINANVAANVNLRGATWDSTNGRILAVGDSGTIIYSSDLGVNWANITSPTTRNLKSITYNKTINKWAVVGDGISFLGTGVTANSSQLQTWGNTTVTSVSRLNFHGSFPYPGTTSLPPAQQRINNATISGSIIDVIPANEISNSYNYWLVVGNLSGNANVYVSAPTLNINWLKR